MLVPHGTVVLAPPVPVGYCNHRDQQAPPECGEPACQQPGLWGRRKAACDGENMGSCWDHPVQGGLFPGFVLSAWCSVLG